MTPARRVDVHGRTCRVCGCTDDRACAFGCSWVEWDLCSTCQFADVVAGAAGARLESGVENLDGSIDWPCGCHAHAIPPIYEIRAHARDCEIYLTLVAMWELAHPDIPLITIDL